MGVERAGPMGDLTVYGTDQTFHCEGSVAKGLLLFYDLTGYVYIPPNALADFLQRHGGQAVGLDTLSAWLRELGFVRDVTRHLAAALIAEGVADGDGHGGLRLRPSAS